MEKRTGIARYEEAAMLLPHRLRRFALALNDHQKERAEELRLRTRRPLTVLTPEGEITAAPGQQDSVVTAEDLEQMVSELTEYSRYASLETLRCGYLSVRGGFRLGVCGTTVLRDGAVYNIKDYSALSLRIVREWPGTAEPLMEQLSGADGGFESTLILSPPGGGKTTLLRDMIRCLSMGDQTRAPLRVAVIDERSEIAVSAGGCAQTELGNHTDVLDACPKALGIPMVLRAMNPQVIAVDEITTQSDCAAACAAANCGVSLLATIHASGVEELLQKPLYRDLLDAKVFRRAVVLERDGEERRARVEPLICAPALPAP